MVNLEENQYPNFGVDLSASEVTCTGCNKHVYQCDCGQNQHWWKPENDSEIK